MFCVNCGSKFVGTAKFCSECGAQRVNSNSENETEHTETKEQTNDSPQSSQDFEAAEISRRIKVAKFVSKDFLAGYSATTYLYVLGDLTAAEVQKRRGNGKEPSKESWPGLNESAHEKWASSSILDEEKANWLFNLNSNDVKMFLARNLLTPPNLLLKLLYENDANIQIGVVGNPNLDEQILTFLIFDDVPKSLDLGKPIPNKDLLRDFAFRNMSLSNAVLGRILSTTELGKNRLTALRNANISEDLIDEYYEPKISLVEELVSNVMLSTSNFRRMLEFLEKSFAKDNGDRAHGRLVTALESLAGNPALPHSIWVDLQISFPWILGNRPDLKEKSRPKW